jgi:negative regulator of genetic competence, sporulation and motility
MEILDFGHVVKELWIAWLLHYGKESDHTEQCVQERALLLLEGDVLSATFRMLRNNVARPPAF